ncbi:hypothetical protein M153_12400002180 [Pseudoloma neurophilia]|uniref:Uncharacterized protein n=1 Tax=Pseudoloma neurophilia TaxID=146866 RepID=A0A0R0LVE8_9MICR|nr:hypothetical protein M153_12400002180 [Pseudoloma neurophilia]
MVCSSCRLFMEITSFITPNMKIQPLNYYDADISYNSTLLVSSTNGLMSIFYDQALRKDRIANDMQCKKVKFYPGDDFLFTTSDNTGLKVWDREKQKNIFTYPTDIILDHIYLEDRTIAAQTEIGIKFFDLRMRYSSTFHKQRNILKMSKSGNNLAFCTRNQIFKYQHKNAFSIYKSPIEILDFHLNVILTKNSLYFIDLGIEKPHTASKIVPVHPNYRDMSILITTVHKNQICFLEQNKDHIETISDCKTIDSAISNRENLYIFADNNLFLSK